MSQEYLSDMEYDYAFCSENHSDILYIKWHHSQNGISNIFTVDDESNKIYSVQNKISIQLKHFKLGTCYKFQEKIILIFPTQIFVNTLRIS